MRSFAAAMAAAAALAVLVAGPVAATTKTPVGAVPVIPGATYQGCFVDDTSANSRSLPVSSGSGVTNAGCLATCSQKGFPVAGTEFGGECYCGANLVGVTQAAATDCNKNCTTNAAEVCGGSKRLTVFKNDTIATFVPKVPIIECTTYYGCWVDTVNPRTFPVFQNSNSTDYDCVAKCQAKGYAFAGTENFSQCFCSSTAPNTTQVDDSICRLPCEGDLFEVCGGKALLTVYQNTGCPPPATSTSAVSSSPVATPTSSASSVPQTTSTPAPPSTDVTTSSSAAASTPATSSPAVTTPATSSADVTTSSSVPSTSTSSVAPPATTSSIVDTTSTSSVDVTTSTATYGPPATTSSVVDTTSTSSADVTPSSAVTSSAVTTSAVTSSAVQSTATTSYGPPATTSSVVDSASTSSAVVTTSSSINSSAVSTPSAVTSSAVTTSSVAASSAASSAVTSSAATTSSAVTSSASSVVTTSSQATSSAVTTSSAVSSSAATTSSSKSTSTSAVYSPPASTATTSSVKTSSASPTTTPTATSTKTSTGATSVPVTSPVTSTKASSSTSSAKTSTSTKSSASPTPTYNCPSKWQNCRGQGTKDFVSRCKSLNPSFDYKTFLTSYSSYNVSNTDAFFSAIKASGIPKISRAHSDDICKTLTGYTNDVDIKTELINLLTLLKNCDKGDIFGWFYEWILDVWILEYDFWQWLAEYKKWKDVWFWRDFTWSEKLICWLNGIPA